MSQTSHHLSVHTEIDIKTDTRSSDKLAGVDCLTSEGVCVVSIWILSSEVTEGASTGPGLISNTMSFEWPRVSPALSLVDIVDISGVLSTGGFDFVISGKSQSVLLSYPTHVTRGVCHHGWVLSWRRFFFSKQTFRTPNIIKTSKGEVVDWRYILSFVQICSI